MHTCAHWARSRTHARTHARTRAHARTVWCNTKRTSGLSIPSPNATVATTTCTHARMRACVHVCVRASMCVCARECVPGHGRHASRPAHAAGTVSHSRHGTPNSAHRASVCTCVHVFMHVCMRVSARCAHTTPHRTAPHRTAPLTMWHVPSSAVPWHGV